MLIDLYLGISDLFFIYLIAYILRLRGVHFDTNDKAKVFLILIFISIFARVCIDEFTDLIFLQYNIPFIICLSLIDLRYRHIFDEDLLFMFICQVGIALFDICRFLPSYGEVLRHMMIYVGSIALYYFTGKILYKLTGAIGEGDVLYFLILGLSGGLDKMYHIFIISFIIASLYAVPIAIKNKSLKGKLAFVPFISMAYIINVTVLQKVYCNNFYTFILH